MKKERSRAYPLVDLETAVGLLSKLYLLSSGTVDRLAIANRLGYSSGEGGVAARKIGALVHFGLLDRHQKQQYQLTTRSRHLLSLAPESPEYLRVLRSLLDQPVLFRSVLDSYRPIGRIPEDLAAVLAQKHGITARASGEAAQVFRQSACFAGVLGRDGTFIDFPLSAPASPAASEPSERTKPLVANGPGRRGGPGARRLPLLLRAGRSGHLEIPPGIDETDFEDIVDSLNFWLPQIHAHAGLGELPAGRVLKLLSGGPRTREPDR